VAVHSQASRRCPAAGNAGTPAVSAPPEDRCLMPARRSCRHTSLPMTVVQRLEALCDRFEDAWRTGQRPVLDDYLRQLPDVDQAILLEELLHLELFSRRRAGESPHADDYLPRWPAHVHVVQSLFDLGETIVSTNPQPPSAAAPVAAPAPTRFGR